MRQAVASWSQLRILSRIYHTGSYQEGPSLMLYKKFWLLTFLLPLIVSGCDSGAVSSSDINPPQEESNPAIGAERPNFLRDRRTNERLAQLRAGQGNSIEVLRAEFSSRFGPMDDQVSGNNGFPRATDLQPSGHGLCCFGYVKGTRMVS